MKALVCAVFLLGLLWALPSSAAVCNVGTAPDEDGCQTISVPSQQGDFTIVSFHLCEEKTTGDTSCATLGEVADPDFDLATDAFGIPIGGITFSIDNVAACTGATVTIFGRDISGGLNHEIGTLEIGGTNSLIVTAWRHQFVTATIADLATCAGDDFNVGMRLYYRRQM